MKRLSILFACLLGGGLGALTQGCHDHCAGTHKTECNCAGSHCDCADSHCQCVDGSCAADLEPGAAWACNVLWADGAGEIVDGELLVYEAADAPTTLDRCQTDAGSREGLDPVCRCLPLAG